jgi:hypothetical protein
MLLPPIAAIESSGDTAQIVRTAEMSQNSPPVGSVPLQHKITFCKETGDVVKDNTGYVIIGVETLGLEEICRNEKGLSMRDSQKLESRAVL